MPRQAPRLEWSAIPNFSTQVVRGDRRLTASIIGAGKIWVVLALEVAADAKDPEAVLSQHSHELVGEYGDVRSAFKAAEDYARDWRPRLQGAACPCDPIGTPDL